MLEVNYSPRKIKGFTASVAAAIDHGALTGNNTGFNFTLKQRGVLDWLSPKK
jgi:hypothetical protein